jgi:hypothetical protein
LDAILTFCRFGACLPCQGRVFILQALFERIYIMRLQVFHGASTKSSSLNRRTLSERTAILFDLFPSMIEVMIRNGLSVDWGSVCLV